MPSEFVIIEADGTNDFRLLEAAGDGTGTDDGEPKLRRFTMTAYTGGKLRLPNFPYPIVVDLSGLKVPAKSRPILRDHNPAQIVGHTESIENSGGGIKLAGVISAVNGHAQEIVESGTNGFPWQASIGAAAQRVVFVDRGESVEVNGRKFTGPLYVARQSTLREVSFVALGADDRTSARMAAQMAAQNGDKDSSSTPITVTDMAFEDWLQALGFEAGDLSEEQKEKLQAMYEEHRQADEEPEDSAEPASEPSANPPANGPASGPVDAGTDGAALFGELNANAQTSAPTYDVSLVRYRRQRAAELRRCQQIAEICAGEHPDIEAKAIEEGWDVTKTELAVLRDKRPDPPAIPGGQDPYDAQILEAAACLSAGLPEEDLAAAYGDRTLSAAYSMRFIGLKELVAECARMEGHPIPRVFGDGQATIRAGFATVSLPGILENVMNKTLLASYRATPIAAFQLASIGSVSDFKEVSRYRLLGTGGFEQVAPSGELKAGRLDEQTYKNKAETYGQILLLTRQDILNDDLDAFLEIPRQMGRSGAELIDDLFFQLLLSNPNTFFSTGNGNFLSGSATAFSSDSLTQAKTQFRKQKAGPGDDPKDQKPINIRPRKLVVPVELETDAELLMGSAQLLLDGATSETKIPVDNPHRNKYEVVSIPHLSDSFYTGASALAWYLFADPRVLPAFEIVFLNGRRTPIIERIEAPPNVLGMGFRAYCDCGVREQDPRGALKVKGEA